MWQENVEHILGQKIVFVEQVRGGCFAQTQKIITDKNEAYFIKTFKNEKFDFRKEANGLSEILKSQAVKIPEIVACEKQFLLLSFVQTGKPKNLFWEDFASGLAQMHKFTSPSYGFYENNYIGSNLQLNIPTQDEKSNWALFFFNKRLKFQFSLLEKSGSVTNDLIHLFSKLGNRYSEIIINDEIPVLLHGDLWSGNFMINESGEPVLIDPAVYFGNREAELAMTRIFGGFPERFYQAYNDCYPLSEGWEYRENIYKLYHLLNHLNLFGKTYYSEVIRLIKYYVE